MSPEAMFERAQSEDGSRSPPVAMARTSAATAYSCEAGLPRSTTPSALSGPRSKIKLDAV
jgi:hypothetical protein